jgi:hypothetical protein
MIFWLQDGCLAQRFRNRFSFTFRTSAFIVVSAHSLIGTVCGHIRIVFALLFFAHILYMINTRHGRPSQPRRTLRCRT